MSNKLAINLLVSEAMSELEEDDRVRFSYGARQHLAITTATLLLGHKSSEVEVEVKPALLSDLNVLKKMVSEGTLPKQDKLSVGFVSATLYRKLTGRNPQGTVKVLDVWGSSDLQQITVGADPEFGFIREDGLLEVAEHVLPGSKTHSFGADGPGVEVRPAPSRNHLDVVKSIAAILAKPPKAAENYEWRGGATFRDPRRVFWFGGHVHLGRPKSLALHQAPTAFSALARVLDHYLALPFLTFDTPEPDQRRDGCPGHRYGHARDIRIKDDYARFEYRTLSGVWLTHPTLAKIAIGVTKGVAEDFYRRVDKLGVMGAVNDYPLTGLDQIETMINRAQLQGLKPQLYEYWRTLLAHLGNREEYAEEIAALIKLVENAPDKVVPQLSLDIRENWQDGRPLLLEAPQDLKAAIKAVEEKK